MKELPPQKIENTRISRRTLLKGGVGLAAAGLVGCAPEPRTLTTPTPLPDQTLIPDVASEPTLESQATLEPTIQLEPSPTSTRTPKPTEKPTQKPTETPTPETKKTPETPKGELVILRNMLSHEIENFHGRNAVAITDVLTGETIHINGDRAQLPGCVANLPVALAAVDGIFDMDSPIKSAEIAPHLYPMVRNSDPHEGVEVVRQLGEGDILKGVKLVNKYMEKWGMNNSFYDHPPAYPGEYSIAEESNLIVPNELNSVLARLAAGKLFSEKARAYILDVMKNNKPGLNFMIPLHIPGNEATVHHKVGWIYGERAAINDAGIVIANNGSFMYSIVLMHEGDRHVTEEELFQNSGLFLGKLSKMAYDSFKKMYV